MFRVTPSFESTVTVPIGCASGSDGLSVAWNFTSDTQCPGREA